MAMEEDWVKSTKNGIEILPEGLFFVAKVFAPKVRCSVPYIILET